MNASYDVIVIKLIERTNTAAIITVSAVEYTTPKTFPVQRFFIHGTIGVDKIIPAASSPRFSKNIYKAELSQNVPLSPNIAPIYAIPLDRSGARNTTQPSITQSSVNIR